MMIKKSTYPYFELDSSNYLSLARAGCTAQFGIAHSTRRRVLVSAADTDYAGFIGDNASTK
jgi:hypothetical protein